ncbi:MAG: MBL fold metallo-hydrolase [Kordiimonadales bacterium]|nr:MAG: MBL fold metallo-hydrolase [Kordiimonadales bacterium]
MTSSTAEAKSASEQPKEETISDHREGAVPRGDENLDYIFGEDLPKDDYVIEVTPGVLWARIPLPWSLDHINVYLLEEEDGWTVIDTGAQGKTGRDIWELLEKNVLGGKPITHVVATHLHPDHLGLAGWLVERHNAKFSMTQAEYLLAQSLWMGASDSMPKAEMEFMFRAGVSRDLEESMSSKGFGHFKKGVHELPYSYERIEDGSIMMLGGKRWQVVIGRGHSPEHACLLCLDVPMMIGGDQILPEITSNVSVYGREPLGNPLAHWLSSLDRMRAIDSDPIVLPSHGRVFKGLINRLDSLIDSHLRKLVRLHGWCGEARSVTETFPTLFRRKVTGMDFFLALGEATAHLHLLESLGLLERSFDGNTYSFQAIGEIDDATIVDQVNLLPGVQLRSYQDIAA